MHEVAIARALVEAAEGAARHAGLECIVRMNVELGEHAGVSPSALSFALDVVRRGSPVESAEIVYSGPGAAQHHEDHEHGADDVPSRTSIRLSWIEGV
jgi:Zn finger protein HypA/HybF involved in hydrogenase expression